MLKFYFVNETTLVNDIIQRTQEVDGQTIYRVVLPRSLRRLAFHQLHSNAGHMGRDRTLSLMRERFYWPHMTRDVEKWVQTCGPCIRRKIPTTQWAPLVSVHTTQPMELVCMDFLSLETSKGGHENILVLTDHFSKYATVVNMPRLYQQRIRLLKPQQKFLLIFLFVTMDSHLVFIVTREETLKAK